MKRNIRFYFMLLTGLILINADGCKKDSGPEVVLDKDGNEYSTIIIGTQKWLAENLKTTKYNDGTQISCVTDNTEWSGNTTGAYCWYDNNVTYKDPYGALYNWYAVNTGKLCPAGWHVPTDEEWTTMEDYLIAHNFNYDGTTSGHKTGKSLASLTLWRSTTTTGAIGNSDFPEYRNKSGFNAFPGGYRFDFNGTFNLIEISGYWWTATEPEYSPVSGFSRSLSFNSQLLGIDFFPKGYGLSVRCVKD